MKKKVISTLLTAGLLATTLAGCGSSSKTPVSTPVDETTTAGATTSDKVSSDDSDTIVVWVQGSIDNTPEWDTVDEMFKKTHPEVKIEWSYMSSGDLDVALTTMASSGDYSTLPDVVLNQDYYFDRYVKNYPDLFMDISDIGVDWSKFSKFKVDNSTIDGKHYGVPYDNGCVMAAYRTDILEQAGYTLEDLTDIDWDRYIEIGKDVYAKTGTPLAISMASEPQLISMMLVSAGSAFFKEDGSTNIVGNEVLKKSIEIYKECVDNNVIREVNDWEQCSSALANNETAGAINGCWYIGTIKMNTEQSGLWGITNMPRLPGIEGATNYSANGGSSFAVIEENATRSDEHFENVKALLNETWGGSLELSGKVLTNGKVLCMNGAVDVPEYKEGVEFFGGEPVFQKIAEYATKVPSVKVGAFYYNGIIASGTAMSNVIQNGADIDKEIQGIEDTLNFEMESQ